MEGSNTAASSPAKLLSDNIMRLVENVESADPNELAGELFGGDEESTRAIIEAFPRLVNAAVQVFKGFAEGLERLPAGAGAELVAGSLSRIDGVGVGEAINSMSRILILLWEHDPKLFTEGRIGVASDTIKTLDFGKLRKSLAYKARARMEYRRETVALMGEEPVALINLVSLIPGYVNNTLELLNQVLDILTFPPEAMTYALFKILEEIDWDELSKALNGAFKFVDALQRGNLLLGDGSSQFKGVMASVSEDLIRNLDFKGASRALSALTDNLEPVVTSLAVAALGREDGALAVGGALLSMSNFSLRSASVILEKASALPPEVIRKMAAGLREGFSTRELGSAINSALVLFNRLTSEDPELLGTIMGGALSCVDLEQAGLVGRTLVSGFSETMIAGPAAGGPLEPGVVGTLANNALASYNRLAVEDPQLLARRLDGFLVSLDEDQVGEAVRSVASQVADAALRNPGVTRAVVGALLSATFKFVKGYMRSLVRKRERGVI